MAPVVLGIELNGYTIYKVKLRGGAYNNPTYMQYIVNSDRTVRGDNGRDYVYFNVRFDDTTSFIERNYGKITENVLSTMFDSIEDSGVYSKHLHDRYDQNCNKGGESDVPADAYRWWVKKNSQLKF